MPHLTVNVCIFLSNTSLQMNLKQAEVVPISSLDTHYTILQMRASLIDGDPALVAVVQGAEVVRRVHIHDSYDRFFTHEVLHNIRHRVYTYKLMRIAPGALALWHYER
jgi:hypothetical protein